MKILFKTAGGTAKNKELGLGHIYRCLNLSKYFKQNQIHFLIEDYGGVKNILTKNGINKVSILKKNQSVHEDIKKTQSYIKQNNIDIVIIDRYKIKKSYVSNLHKFVKTVVVSDLNDINFNADLIVNGFIGFRNRITENKYKRKCLVGPKYQIVNKKFQKNSNKKKEFQLLATFGGYDESNISEKIIKIIIKNNIKIKIKIILGQSTKKSQINLLLKKKKIGIEIVKSTNDMYKEIINSEFGLCSGGITTYEFASQKVPFGIISQNNHQIITANEWEKIGIASNLGTNNGNIEREILQFFKLILAKKKMKKTNLVDGLGAKRISKEILKLK